MKSSDCSSFWCRVKSFFGLGCRRQGTGSPGRIVLVGAKTVSPDQRLNCEFKGDIRSYGNDFIYEFVPVMGLRIQTAQNEEQLAELHFYEADREATSEALTVLIEGNGDRIPSGFRIVLDSAGASLSELQKTQEAGRPVPVTLQAVYSYDDGSPDVNSAVFPGILELRYDNPNLIDTYFMQEAFMLWYCYETFGGTGKSKKKGWTVCSGWCFVLDCLCAAGPPPAAVCLGWVKCTCM